MQYNGSSRRVWLRGAVAFVGALLAGASIPAPVAAQEKPVVVFAAASLKNALDDVTTQYQKETGKHVTVSFAASSTLAKQVENGAPADIFISADPDWMDYLAKRNLIKPDTRSDLLGNGLVLIAPHDSKISVTIAPNFPLASLLGDGRLAMADPRAVPAGLYGKAALEKLGVWSSVESHVAAAENVRAALLLVSRGETPLGIVYTTDAAADTGVKIVATFPADSHPPIIYPMAVTANSTNPDAAAFAAYLQASAVRPLFEKQGFTVLPGAAGK